MELCRIILTALIFFTFGCGEDPTNTKDRKKFGDDFFQKQKNKTENSNTNYALKGKIKDIYDKCKSGVSLEKMLKVDLNLNDLLKKDTSKKSNKEIIDACASFLVSINMKKTIENNKGPQLKDFLTDFMNSAKGNEKILNKITSTKIPIEEERKVSLQSLKSEELIKNISTSFVKNFENKDCACFEHTALQLLMSILVNLHPYELVQKINKLSNKLKGTTSSIGKFTQKFIEIVRKYLTNGNSRIPYESFTKTLRKQMVEEIKKEVNKIDDNEMKQKGHKQRIDVHGQHDSGEFFTRTLNIIKDTEKIVSINDYIFKGLDIEIETKKECVLCDKVSIINSVSSHELQLHISNPNTKDLEKYIDEYFNKEIMDKDNAITCEKCKKKTAHYKWDEIKKYPEILIINLIRYEFDSILGTKKKLTHLVEYKQVFSFNKNKEKYKLIAVAMHNGETIKSGHYTAYINVNNKWYLTDDTREIPNEVHNDEQLNQKDAMMLCYIKEKNS